MTQNTYKHLIAKSGNIYMNLRPLSERLKKIAEQKEVTGHLIDFINSKGEHSLKLSKEIARMLVSNLDIGIGVINSHAFKLDYTLVEKDLESLYRDSSELGESLGYFEHKWYGKFKTNDPFVQGQIEKDLSC